MVSIWSLWSQRLLNFFSLSDRSDHSDRSGHMETRGAFHLLELAGRTSQLASEIGFSQECLLKNYPLRVYYLGFVWSGWISFNSKWNSHYGGNGLAGQFWPNGKCPRLYFSAVHCNCFKNIKHGGLRELRPFVFLVYLIRFPFSFAFPFFHCVFYFFICVFFFLFAVSFLFVFEPSGPPNPKLGRPFTTKCLSLGT